MTEAAEQGDERAIGRLEDMQNEKSGAITHDLDRLYGKTKRAEGQGAVDDELDAYRNAVRMGHAVAEDDPKRLLDLGMSMITGAEGDSDVGQGIACIKITAEAGLPEAMHLYAKLIAGGYIPDQDLSDALVWALRALKGGFPDDGLIDEVQEKMKA